MGSTNPLLACASSARYLLASLRARLQEGFESHSFGAIASGRQASRGPPWPAGAVACRGARGRVPLLWGSQSARCPVLWRVRCVCFSPRSFDCGRATRCRRFWGRSSWRKAGTIFDPRGRAAKRPVPAKLAVIGTSFRCGSVGGPQAVAAQGCSQTGQSGRSAERTHRETGAGQPCGHVDRRKGAHCCFGRTSAPVGLGWQPPCGWAACAPSNSSCVCGARFCLGRARTSSSWHWPLNQGFGRACRNTRPGALSFKGPAPRDVEGQVSPRSTHRRWS